MRYLIPLKLLASVAAVCLSALAVGQRSGAIWGGTVCVGNFVGAISARSFHALLGHRLTRISGVGFSLSDSNQGALK